MKKSVSETVYEAARKERARRRLMIRYPKSRLQGALVEEIEYWKTGASDAHPTGQER